jgi:hypothetical protein
MNRVTILRIAVIVIGSIILIFSTMKQNQPAEAQQYKSNFEVVDRYQNRCDVIQYTPDNSARYSYFLDCK